MSDTKDSDSKLIMSQQPSSPVVTLTRIKHINTYEVLDSDLDSLDQIVAAENRALAFATFSLGTCISTLVPFLVSPPPEAAYRAWTTYLAVTLIFGIFTVWFTVVWLQARKARPRLLDRIRKTTSLEVTQTLESPAK